MNGSKPHGSSQGVVIGWALGPCRTTFTLLEPICMSTQVKLFKSLLSRNQLFASAVPQSR